MYKIVNKLGSDEIMDTVANSNNVNKDWISKHVRKQCLYNRTTPLSICAH